MARGRRTALALAAGMWRRAPRFVLGPQHVSSPMPAAPAPRAAPRRAPAAPAAPAADAARKPRAATPTPAKPANTGSGGGNPMSAGMSAFMKMELRLAAKRKQQAAEAAAAAGESEESDEAVDSGDAGAAVALELLSRPVEPTEPLMEECCGNDCPNCVWIQYWEAQQKYDHELEAYEAQQATMGAR